MSMRNPIRLEYKLNNDNELVGCLFWNKCKAFDDDCIDYCNNNYKECITYKYYKNEQNKK